MTTLNKIKQEIIAWSVIAVAFGMLTFAALNLDTIRQSPLLNPTQGSISPQHVDSDFQPGNTVVLAQ